MHIDLWTINLNQPDEVRGKLHRLLSPQEQHRAARFLLPDDHAHYIVAHAATRSLLGAALGIAPHHVLVEQGKQGKPYLPGLPLHFNLSHAGGQALLAVSSLGPLGVDLEPVRLLPDFLALAESFSAPERAQLNALARSPDLPLAFFQCWTRKEAFLKAVGTGLSAAETSLAAFEVTFRPSQAVELRSHGADVAPRQLCDLTLFPGFAAALVHPRISVPPELHIRNWNP